MIFDFMAKVQRHPRWVILLNRDPDRYATKIDIEKLEKLVIMLDQLYHNGPTHITDTTYDTLVYHLNNRLKAKNRKYANIGALPVNKVKATLPYPMPSLDKVKPNTKELAAFLGKYGQCMVASEKLDGVSGMIVYKDSTIRGIYTRGNGVIGSDITYLKDYIKLPKEVPTDYVVRGEFVISRKLFDKKYHKMYSNPRNFVISKINSKSVTNAVSDIDFIAYDIIKIPDSDTLPEMSRRFALLKEAGFKVVNNYRVDNFTIFQLVMLYKTKRNDNKYDIDGLVLASDVQTNVLCGEQALKSPTTVVAFKMLLEEQIKETVITGIDWNITRYGRYVPVAQYQPVFINGIRLKRANAHNARHIKDWSMGAGTKIKVVRSGDVIPNIVDVTVDRNILPIYPSTTYPWSWDPKNVHIVLDEIGTNREVQIKRIVHFFTTIGAAGLRDKTVSKLWDSGLTDINKIIAAAVDDFTSIKGVGKKTAQNITNAMRTTRIDRFLEAATIMDVGIGRALIKHLLKYCPQLFKLSGEEIKNELTVNKVKGFGPKRIKNLSENIPRFMDYLFNLDHEGVKAAIKYNDQRLANIESTGYNQKIKDKMFVFTGFFGKTNYNLEDFIYDNRGIISKGVKADTEAIIYASCAGVSEKMIKGYDLDIPVLSIEEFYNNYRN